MMTCDRLTPPPSLKCSTSSFSFFFFSLFFFFFFFFLPFWHVIPLSTAWHLNL